MLGEMKLLIPLAGLIDKDAERQRLEREIDRFTKDVERGEKKLANEKFVARAPAEVVAKERDKVDAAKVALAKLKEQLQQLERL